MKYTPAWIDGWAMIYHGDCLEVLRGMETGSVHCCVTSPPYYGLRDYGVDGQIGMEDTPGEYVRRLSEVFGEVKRVLRDDGTLWLNLGDSYGGSWGTYGSNKDKGLHSYRGLNRFLSPASKLPPKNLLGIPWRAAFALQEIGWILRSDIIWAKPNPTPESVTDRPTQSHEHVFLLVKTKRYHYDQDSIREPLKTAEKRTKRFVYNGKSKGTSTFMPPNHKGRNKRTVWTVASQSFSGAHFATFPEKLIEPCVKAGCPEGGTVLDPFAGSGTTGIVARKFGCRFVGIELKREYVDIMAGRLDDKQMRLIS